VCGKPQIFGSLKDGGESRGRLTEFGIRHMVILMTFSEIVLDARKSQNHTTLSPAGDARGRKVEKGGTVAAHTSQA